MQVLDIGRGAAAGAIIALLTLSAAPGVRAAEEVPLTIEELNIRYVSGEDPDLTLYAAFLKSGTDPKPILVYLPGWGGNRYYVYRDLRQNKFMLDRFFLVCADMRGRGARGDGSFGGTPDPGIRAVLPDGPVSDGVPDANGWELNDIVDAAECAKRLYPEHTLPDPVYAMGHSGGGGNAMGLVGKFPDYFTAVYAGSGMSDYGKWAELYGGLRADVERYVGAAVGTNPMAFASRGGLTTVANRLTPIALSHGTADVPVPFVLSEMYVKANADLGRPVPFKVVDGGPHGVWGHYDEMTAFMLQYTKPPALPDAGQFTIGGYVKTRRLQILLPSVDAVTTAEYDLGGGCRIRFEGGLPGPLRVRLPAAAEPGRGSCRNNAGPVQVEQGLWHDWVEFTFAYDGVAASFAAE